MLQSVAIFRGESNMAIVSFLSRMTIHADKEQQFIEACEALTEKVLAHEPACLYFRFYKLREEPLGPYVREYLDPLRS